MTSDVARAEPGEPDLASDAQGRRRSPPTPFRPSQELRFAVVMYGGVSLAVYINGVVQELLSLVRATAPEVATGSNPTETMLRTDELKGTEAVYRKLGQLVGWGDSGKAEEHPDADAPVRTRFVVDIISGSSAGGINGLFLGKALANEGEISQLKRLWIDEGDIKYLVNDAESMSGLDGLARERQPRSLLNSRRMYWQILQALHGVDAGPDPVETSRLVDELDVWITATDIRGLTLPIDLYDRVVFEKRHKNVFRFRYGSVYATGSDRNDFVRSNNPVLAFAARATSAFPAAFEPMALDDIGAVIGVPAFRDYARRGAECADFEGFFRDYVDARKGSQPELPSSALYRSESFGDGGYLDNKPFTWATSTLSRRRADLPVDRRLIYIEPEPSGPPAQARRPGEAPMPVPWEPPAEKVNPIDNVRAALVGLPRSEAIREDLEELIERNRNIARIRDIARLADDLAAGGSSTAPRASAEEWSRLTAMDLLARYGVQYAAYHRLKVASVLDDLAELITCLAGYGVGSDENAAVRCFVQAWFEAAYDDERAGEDGTAGEGGGLGETTPRTQTAFLLDFDASYRLRRLNFVNERVDELLRFDARALGRLELFAGTNLQVSDVQPAIEAALLRLKRELNATFVALRSTVRGLRRRSEDNPLLELLAAVTLPQARLLSVLHGATSKEESVARARDVLSEDGLTEHLDALASKVADELRQALRDASESGAAALASPAVDGAATAPERVARAAVDDLYSKFEAYDSILFALGYGVIDEADPVEIIRISPQDATSLIDESDGKRRKLGGTSLHHFGGFFERRWRVNDILWGRLDGAERLIETLLPEGELRDDLLREAQLAIIRDEFDAGPVRTMVVHALVGGDPTADPDAVQAAVAAAAEPHEILEHLRTSYDVDRTIDTAALVRTASRATRVTGALLDGLTGEYRLLSTPARWFARIGRLAFLLVEAATPRKLRQILARYWLALLLIVALVMILGGPLVGSSEAASTGWILLGVIAAIKVVLWALSDIFAGRIRAAYVVAVLVTAALLGLAVVEVSLHLDEDVGSLVSALPDWLERPVRWLWPFD